MLELGSRHVRLVHLHEVDVHEERCCRLAVAIKIIQRSLLDVFVEERNADDTPVGGVDVLSVDLEVLVRGLAGIARHRALCHALKHGAQLGRHVRKPGRIGIGVCIEVIKPRILHLVVALGIWQRVVGFAEMPFAREECLVTGGLQHRGQRPLGGRQSAALPLERDRCHAAAIRNAPGLHGGTAGRAARLGIE